MRSGNAADPAETVNIVISSYFHFISISESNNVVLKEKAKGRGGGGGGGGRVVVAVCWLLNVPATC